MSRHLSARLRRFFYLGSFGVFATGVGLAGPENTLASTVHIGLASSVPAKGAHLMTTPTEIRLTFTGPVDVAKAGVELLTADSTRVALDPLRAVADSPRVATARITGALAGGTYTVTWRAVARDGAEGAGSFTFMYMKQSEPDELSDL